MRRKRKIVIINAGSWGMLEREDYDSHLKALVPMLELACEPSEHEKEDLPDGVAYVTVISSVEDAEALASRGLADIVIFISRGMLDEARAFRKAHSSSRVVLLTGLIPEEEVVILDKRWLVDSEMQRHLVRM